MNKNFDTSLYEFPFFTFKVHLLNNHFPTIFFYIIFESDCLRVFQFHLSTSLHHGSPSSYVNEQSAVQRHSLPRQHEKPWYRCSKFRTLYKNMECQLMKQGVVSPCTGQAAGFSGKTRDGTDETDCVCLACRSARPPTDTTRRSARARNYLWSRIQTQPSIM